MQSVNKNKKNCSRDMTKKVKIWSFDLAPPTNQSFWDIDILVISKKGAWGWGWVFFDKSGSVIFLLLCKSISLVLQQNLRFIVP